jgi:ribose 5-phosphate isomerase A
VDFGVIDNPSQLNRKLKSIHGVIETGLFLGMASTAYIGTKTGIKIIKKGE